MALVERVEASEDGAIWFCATSVESSKIPLVQGRARARMLLTGLVLRPIQRNQQEGTWLSYYLQVDAAGFLPKAIASRVMARRPVCIYKIEEYLIKNGSPIAAEPQSHREDRGHPVSDAVGVSHQDKASYNDLPGQQQALEATLPPQVGYEEKHASSGELSTAKRKFEELLAESRWERAQDASGSAIYMKKNSSKGPITTKGQAKIGEDVTTEQVLGIIASPTARQLCRAKPPSARLKLLNDSCRG